MSTDCSHQWTVRFPDIEGTDGPFEIVPLTLNFKSKHSKFKRAKAKFSADVAAVLKPETRAGQLSERHLVELLNDGESIYRMVFDPNNAQYGANYAHLTLLDPQQTLDQTTVDIQRGQIWVRSLYEELYEKGDSDFLNGIKFTDSDELNQGYVARGSIGATEFNDAHRRRYRAEEDIEIIDGSLAVDYRDQTPAQVIWDLNERFGLSSWVDRDGIFWVGTPETSESMHVAAPDDSRVWRWTNANIRHPRRPVKRVVVKGTWLESPELSQNVKDDTVGLFKDKSHFGDERAIGIAERHDVEVGTELVVEDNGAKKDVVPAIAHRKLAAETANAYTGQVTINPNLGGELTPFTEARVGDFIHIVPEDEPFDAPYTASTGHIGDDPPDAKELCQNLTDNEIYTITGVTHNVNESGGWRITLDVKLYPEELTHVNDGGEVHTALRYFRPYEEDYHGDPYYPTSKFDDE